MRYIERGAGAQRRCLFPNFFSENQYERLKNALSDNVSCKVPGCYNNYADTRNHNQAEETRVMNGRCGYHRRTQNNINNQNNRQGNNFNADELNANYGNNHPEIVKFNQLRARNIWGMQI